MKGEKISKNGMVLGLQGLQAPNLLKALVVIAQVNSLRSFIYVGGGGVFHFALNPCMELVSQLFIESPFYTAACVFFFKCLLSA